MKAARAALLVVFLIALVALFVWNYQQRSDPAYLIEKAAAGSESSLKRLEAFDASEDLPEHSDLIGQTIVELAKSRPEAFDREDPVLSRWHDLYLTSDPLLNASEQSRIDFARSTLLLKPILPEAVLPGHKQSVGLQIHGSLRLAAAGRADRYRLTVAPSGVLVNGQEVWPEGLESVSTTHLGASGNSVSSSSFRLLLLPDEAAAASDQPATIKLSYVLSIFDDTTQPPSEFASWTEEIVLTRPIKDLFGDAPVDPLPGQVELETVRSLLTNASAGDESSIQELLAIGERGELRPFADEIGILLAQQLRDDWRPRMLAYYEEQAWHSPRIDAHQLPTLDEYGALLIGLFFLADPVTTASPETWAAVGQAGVFVKHAIEPPDTYSDQPAIGFRILTPLVQGYSLGKVKGVKLNADRTEFGTTPVPININGGQYVTSSSSDQRPSRRSYLSAPLRDQNSAYVFSPEVAAQLDLIEGAERNDIRTFVELSLMHDIEIELATWPVVIDHPVVIPEFGFPLDESTPDRR